jgi:hypothetical protein
VASSVLPILLGAGLALALLRIGVRSQGFSAPGRGAVTDLLGCGLAAGAMWGVLGIRALADGRALGGLLEDGLGTLALAVWVVALVPPRAENYRGGPTDDFVLAYAPVSLAAPLVLTALRRWWPGRDRREVVLRHLAGLAVLLLALGGLVAHVAQGPGARDVLHRCLALSALAGLGLGAGSRAWPAEARS